MEDFAKEENPHFYLCMCKLGLGQLVFHDTAIEVFLLFEMHPVKLLAAPAVSLSYEVMEKTSVTRVTKTEA